MTERTALPTRGVLKYRGLAPRDGLVHTLKFGLSDSFGTVSYSFGQFGALFRMAAERPKMLEILPLDRDIAYKVVCTRPRLSLSSWNHAI